MRRTEFAIFNIIIIKIIIIITKCEEGVNFSVEEHECVQMLSRPH
jgi:hypothetical protein